MKTRNINHARNLLDRAVTILPRVDKFWYKYVYMEETLGNIPGTRQVFERWMSWEPDEAAWSAFIKLEKRYGEYDRARTIFQRFTIVHPEPKNWIKWARFEEEYGTEDLVREVFTMAIDALGEEFMDEKVFIAYARFETKLKEYERARVIYKYALDRLPRSKSIALHQAYTTFEKQFGEREGVEDVILSKHRVQYEEKIKENPKNYDVWFDYARLEETLGDVEKVRDVYERAIAQIPPTQEKRHWRRYIYLWINYALYEELETKDIDRTRQIYSECLKLIPHRKFTFAKVWLLKAEFEIRQLQLQSARKTLGQALGMCPKDKIFKGYIELEWELYEFNRCRTLYQKYIEFNPANCQAWMKFAEKEAMLEDFDRSRGIFELAVQQGLDMPELLWKAYIDFEEGQGEYDRTRALYERLLQKTEHVKVWISYAQFELNIPEDEEDGEDAGIETEKPVSEEAKTRARKVFERAYKCMKEKDLKEEVRTNPSFSPILLRSILSAFRGLTCFYSNVLASTPFEYMEVIRSYLWHRKRRQKAGSPDAKTCQETEKARRRHVRRVYGLFVPRRRAAEPEAQQTVGDGTQVEAEPSGRGTSLCSIVTGRRDGSCIMFFFSFLSFFLNQ